MAETMRIGASLYSFQLEYIRCQWSFEDCMQLAAHTGGDPGIEIVGPMHHRCWPYLSKEFERQFKSGCERWAVIPVQYSSYAEASLITDLDDLFDLQVIQMKTAQKLGFSVFRAHSPGTDPILEKMARLAEKMKLKVAVELTPSPVLINPAGSFIDTVKKVNSEWLGINADTNMFADRSKDPAPPPGAPQPRERNPVADPELLKTIMPWLMHMHGKFYYVDSKTGEIPGVPFDKIIEIVVKAGFKGWMMTEFEGGNLGGYSNSFEVVKAHHAIIKRAIAKYSKA
jgi:sugar phosphate isomerase/epimerase